VKQTRWRRLLGWLGKLLLAALVSSIVSVALLRFIDPPMWTWRLERALFPPAKVAEVKHDWVPLERISRELQLAVIAAEDQRFADHNGFDIDYHCTRAQQPGAGTVGIKVWIYKGERN
jgi:monofunctional biosynthetic peptidoglycan transglycosylase